MSTGFVWLLIQKIMRFPISLLCWAWRRRPNILYLYRKQKFVTAMMGVQLQEKMALYSVTPGPIHMRDFCTCICWEQADHWLCAKLAWPPWTVSVITWWRHQTETFSALLVFCAGNSLLTGEFPEHRSVARSFDVLFDLAWTNSWANSGHAGDLRRHRDHYDVIVMISNI